MPRTRTKPEPPGPIICKPLGSLPLTEVAGMPNGIFAPLLTAGIHTLMDLEKRVAKQSKAHSSQEAKVFAAIRTIPGVDAPMAIAACDAVMAHLTLSPAPVVAKSTPPVVPVQSPVNPDNIRTITDNLRLTPEIPPASEDFDEETPPPRSRPVGSPVPAFVKLPPAATEHEFEEWGKAGRIPEGSVLARFVGTLDSPSGYAVGNKPLPLERLRNLCQVTVVMESPGNRMFVVLKPIEAAR